MTKLLLISLCVLVLNIPFGYWRSNVKAFSTQWFLAIHIPVPFIVGLRLVTGLGFAWQTYVFLVAAFFLGQRAGTSVLKWLRHSCSRVSSCLVMDLVRCIKA